MVSGATRRLAALAALAAQSQGYADHQYAGRCESRVLGTEGHGDGTGQVERAYEMTAQKAIEEFYDMIIRSIGDAPDYVEKREALEAAGVHLEQIDVHLFIDQTEAKSRADEEFLRGMAMAP